MKTYTGNGDEQRGRDTWRSSKPTHHWRELSHDGNQKPDDTLTRAAKHRWIESMVVGKKCHRPTWFHKRHPKPIRPPWRRRRRRPKNMMESSATSVTNAIMVLSLTLSSWNAQRLISSFQEERNCRSIKVLQVQIGNMDDYSPAKHLKPDYIWIQLLITRRR